MWFRATDNILNDDLYVRNVGYFCSKCGIIVFSVVLHIPFCAEANQKGGAQSGAVGGAVSGCTGLLWQMAEGRWAVPARGHSRCDIIAFSSLRCRSFLESFQTHVLTSSPLCPSPPHCETPPASAARAGLVLMMISCHAAGAVRSRAVPWRGPRAVAIGEGRCPAPPSPCLCLVLLSSCTYQSLCGPGGEPCPPCSVQGCAVSWGSAARARQSSDGGWQGGSPPVHAHHWFLITAFSPERLPVPRHPLLLLLFPLLLLPAPSFPPLRV